MYFIAISCSRSLILFFFFLILYCLLLVVKHKIHFNPNIQSFIGTGKSVTGAHIAYILAMKNRKVSRGGVDKRPFVLYCGPSNKSVDVVFGNISIYKFTEFTIKAMQWFANRK